MDPPYMLISEGQGDVFSPTQPSEGALIQVTILHSQLKERLSWQEEGVDGLLSQMMAVKCPLSQKCMDLDVRSFFLENSEVKGGLESLQRCFSVLSKYAQNLLVKPEGRPPTWRNVNFSNTTFVQNVSFIKGSENVFTKLGYTISTPEGLVFPYQHKPDVKNVAQVTADLKILDTELLYYNLGTHPNPECVEEVIPQQWRHVPGLGNPQNQGTSPTQQSPMAQSQVQPQTGQGHFPVQGRQLPANQGHFIGLGHQHSEIQRQLIGQFQPYQQGQPQSGQLPRGEGHQDRGQGNPIQQFEQEEEELFHDAQEHLAATSLECDICGSEKAVRMCRECDGKQLCRECDQTWHSNPRRKTHDRLYLDTLGKWTKRPRTGTKPKIPPDKTMNETAALSKSIKVPPSATLPKPSKVPAQAEGTQVEPLPNLSIFSEQQRPVPPPNLIATSVARTTSDEKQQIAFDNDPSSDQYQRATDSLRLRDNRIGRSLGQSYQKGISLLDEIKAIPNKEDQVSRISHELSELDIRLSQCQQELNIMLKSEDFDFDNPEYNRLSRLRDHMNRSKMLIEEYWKEVEREKSEVQMGNVWNPNTTEDESPKITAANIKYPPGSEYIPRMSAFDFEEDIEFPVQKGSPQREAVHTKESKYEWYTPKSGQNEEKEAANQPIEWICSHCTFRNNMNSEKCSVCLQESEQPSLVFDSVPKPRQTAWEDIQEKTEKEPAGKTGDTKSEKLCKSGEYKSIFVDIQDDIFRQKQEAQAAEKRRMAKKETSGVVFEGDEDDVRIKRPPKPEDLGQNASGDSDYLPGVDYSVGLEDVRKRDTYLEPQVKPRPTAGREDQDADYIDMQSKLEQISKKREQEEVNIQSRELIRILRKAESDGYSIKEVEIAMEQSEFPDPFYWIDVVWEDRVTAVMQEVSDALAAQYSVISNLVLVTKEEARKALQDSNGQQQEAVEVLEKSMESELSDLLNMGKFTEEQIVKVLEENQSDKQAIEQALLEEFFKEFEQKLWTEEGQEYDLNIVLEQKLRSKDLDIEHRIRMVLCEYADAVKFWGRAENVVRLLDDMPEDVTVVDVIEAVRQCNARAAAYNYLQQECLMCYSSYPASKILSLTLCQCKICHECMKGYFEVQIKERHIKNLCCPACQMPEDVESEEAENHLQFLHNFLMNLVSPEVFHIFEDKIRDWHLMKDPNFRWCSSLNCENGFIFNPEGNRLKMRCDRCHNFTCFKCKKPWAEQHENVSCERFKAWQEANNPEFQEAGLAKHLQENGIDCPKCKMRYSLAKGGCMHFKCTQCGHEFCCGCNRPFLHRGACKELESCESQGLHCHHPRDCLYYLRDSDVAQLQQLLEDNNVEFCADNPDQGDDKCMVLEQKETQAGLRDEPCGKEVQPNQSGLCVLHYKEYLVSEINLHAIDPVTHMKMGDIETLYRRREQLLPPKQQEESDSQYKQRLVNEVKLKFKLDRRIQVL